MPNQVPVSVGGFKLATYAENTPEEKTSNVLHKLYSPSQHDSMSTVTFSANSRASSQCQSLSMKPFTRLAARHVKSMAEMALSSRD